MSTTCDCTVRCGDDPWLKDGSGRATPCQNRLEWQRQKRIVDEELAKITALRKTYGADTLHELLDKMHVEIVRLKGEAKVMTDLLEMSINVLETIDEDDFYERDLLKTFIQQIAAVVDARRLATEDVML